MWQDFEKYLHAVMLMGPFVFVLVAAQLAQTSALPLIPDAY